MEGGKVSLKLKRSWQESYMAWGIFAQENWMSSQVACLCAEWPFPSPPQPHPGMSVPLSPCSLCSCTSRMWHLAWCHVDINGCVCSALLPGICSSLHSNQRGRGCCLQRCTWPGPSLECFGLETRKERQLLLPSKAVSCSVRNKHRNLKLTRRKREREMDC